MTLLRHRDFSAALDMLHGLHASSGDAATYARAAVRALHGMVAAEITTLSVCNLRTGHRSVVATPGAAFSRAEIEAFDLHFREHPLVRFHGARQRLVAQRISDCMPMRAFRDSGLYADYYARIGIDHAVAVPLMVDRGLLVSFVLNRTASDFSDRERELLDLLRPHLARFYAQACTSSSPASLEGADASLTPREKEVLAWLARGKTDRDIGQILGISQRTVQKHLEHVYVKLGVETRTAAVLRAGALVNNNPAPRSMRSGH